MATLSAPLVNESIYECASTVAVTGCVPGTVGGQIFGVAAPIWYRGLRSWLPTNRPLLSRFPRYAPRGSPSKHIFNLTAFAPRP
jgi:hypothetical protein